MLSITTPGHNFFLEQEYIARLFCEMWLGVEPHIVAGGDGRWHISTEQREISLPNVFFPEDTPCKWGTEPHGRPQHNYLIDVTKYSAHGGPQKLPTPFAKPDASTIEHVDFFGLFFFFLSRYEEWTTSQRDPFNRIDEKGFWQYIHGNHRIPIVDEWACILARYIKNKLIPGIPPRDHSYVLHVSHDIDMPFIWSANSKIRAALRIGKRFVNSRSLTFACRSLYSYFHPELDPFFSFYWYMDAEEQRGLRSASYFLASARHPFDIPYSLSCPIMQRLFRDMQQRNHEIGIHGSFLASELDGLLSEEVTLLRKATGTSMIGGRQHWLTYNPAKTWRLWSQAGLQYDSTLGYAEDVGFRCGTCRSYWCYDFITRTRLPIQERPLLVMEGALIEKQYLNLTHADAYDVVLELNKQVRRHGGDFTLLWHNNTLYSARDRELYLLLLDACA